MEQDKEMREKFSKVLDAPVKKRNPYDSNNERILYSWEEIFCEIGKLQERAHHKNPPPFQESGSGGWSPPANICGNGI